MALKILTPEEMLKARWNQPRMTRAEAARQLRATMSDPRKDAHASSVKSPSSLNGQKRDRF